LLGVLACAVLTVPELPAAAWADQEDEAQGAESTQGAEGDEEAEETLEGFEETDEADHKGEDEEEIQWLTDADVDQLFGEEGIPGGGGLFAPPEEGQRPQPAGGISATREKIVELSSGVVGANGAAYDAWLRTKRKKALKLWKGLRWRGNAVFDDVMKMMWTHGVRDYRVGDMKRWWPSWTKRGKLPKYCPHAGKSIRIEGDDTRCPFNDTWWRSKKKKPEWCAAFVSMIWRAAMGDDLPAELSGHAPTLQRILNEKGLFVPYAEGVTPEPGDILFERKGSTEYAHVGLVVVVWSDGRFWMLEGNFQDRMQLFEYGANHPRRKRISGFGKPERPAE
jgi:hypothetical protein